MENKAADDTHKSENEGPTEAQNKARKRSETGVDQRRADHLKAAIDRGHLGKDEEERDIFQEALAWMLRLNEIASNPGKIGEPLGSIKKAGIEIWQAGAGVATTINPEALQGYAQHYTRAHQIGRRIKTRMGVLMQPLQYAVSGLTMKKIGLLEGGGESAAAARGCVAVAYALRQLALIRRQILKEESSDDFLIPYPGNDNSKKREAC